MPKEEWGVKRVCPSCAVRFYDLQRDPMTCPSCNEEFSLESLTQPKGKSAGADKSAAKKDKATAEVVETDDDVVLDDDDDADDVDIDSELLDDDDDDEDNVSLEEIADVPAPDDE